MVKRDLSILNKFFNKIRSQKSDLSRLANAIISNTGVGIYVVQHGKFVYVSQLYQKLTGFEDTELIGAYSLDNIHPDDRKMVREEAIKRLKTESFGPYEYRFINKKKEIMWVLETITPIVYKRERATLGSFMDITERKHMEQKLQFQEQRFRALVEHASDIIVLINREGNITYINPAVEKVLGFKPEERIGAKGFELVHPDDAEFLADSFMTLVTDANPRMIRGEMHLRHKEGSWRTLEAVGSNLINHQVVESVIVNYRDITERKQAEEALRRSEQKYRELSIVDDLTQLYNSRHFHAQLKIEIERSSRYDQNLTLLLLDIDDFKAFNDTYGHVEGDYVLSRIGQIIKRCLRETDSAYRYGGEEFTIILPMATSWDGMITAKRIQTELKKEAFSPEAGREVYMTMSIGLSKYRPKEEMKAFVRRIDQLMYQAKKDGKNRICSES